MSAQKDWQKCALRITLISSIWPLSPSSHQHLCSGICRQAFGYFRKVERHLQLKVVYRSISPTWWLVSTTVRVSRKNWLDPARQASALDWSRSPFGRHSQLLQSDLNHCEPLQERRNCKQRRRVRSEGWRFCFCLALMESAWLGERTRCNFETPNPIHACKTLWRLHISLPQVLLEHFSS